MIILGDYNFTFIDLFAGIGGLRIPFDELGGKCVFSCEIDKYAVQTYEANFGETPSGDIRTVPSSDIPDFDILLGGFPCQPFSIAGDKLGFDDTRGTLFFEIERIIKDKRPKMFLLENVKHLIRHDHGRTFNVILNHLKALGYYVTFKVLRASDYGMLQNRERIYIIGIDKFRFDIDDEHSFKYPTPHPCEMILGDILEENVGDKYTVSDRMWNWHKRRKEYQKSKGNGYGYSLFDGNATHVNTISARYYKDGNELLIDRGCGLNPRRLTPRECARLQGFPETYKLVCSDTQSYKQLGNSVPVPVVREIAQAMINQWKVLE